MTFPPQLSKIPVFPEPINVLKMLSRCPLSYNYSSSFCCYNTLEGGDLRKNNKNRKSVTSFFLPTAKYNEN